MDSDRDRIMKTPAVEEAVWLSREAEPIQIPVDVLSDEELDAPIEISSLGADSPPEPMPGWKGGSISGYSLISVIGRGGQGIVLRAVQKATGKAVAVKVLSGGRFASAHAASRFNREAEILATLDHPNIVGILDRGTTSDGSAFLVMPLVRGTDLASHLRTLIDTRSILLLFAKIASAVGVLHERGICHRDLKPTNIRIDHRGEPRILDFGLAVEHGPVEHTAVTETGQILGSLAWASPEQARGETSRVGPRSDVYSLGVMLYTALHGVAPYATDGPIHEVVKTICRHRPAITLDGQTAQVVARSLSKMQERRYANGTELADDLEKAALSPPPRISRRTRRIVGRLALVAVAAACSTGLYLKALRHSANVDQRSATIKLPERLAPASMRMLQIPAGSFLMGSPPLETEHRLTEIQHTEIIPKPFWISATLVTCGQYQNILGLKPDKIDPGFPVTNVSWIDAKRFCDAIGRLDGRTYRLPTEVEWEYSCRASATSVEYALPRLEDVAWFDVNSGGVLHPAGVKMPNRWGLLDPEGNAAQWCEDLISGPGMPIMGNSRAIRGGSFKSPADQCRCAYRRLMRTTAKESDVGFRVVSE
jgi:serine/threonine protein kinase